MQELSKQRIESKTPRNIPQEVLFDSFPANLVKEYVDPDVEGNEERQRCEQIAQRNVHPREEVEEQAARRAHVEILVPARRVQLLTHGLRVIIEVRVPGISRSEVVQQLSVGLERKVDQRVVPDAAKQ